MKAIAYLVMTVGFIGAIGMMQVMQSREEIEACRNWQEQAVQYKQYFITHWQAEQCATHHMRIDAQVR